MSPKKKLKNGNEGVSSSQNASQMDIDDLLIELGAMRSRMDTMEKNMEAVTKQNEAVTAELAVPRAVIVQMKQREAHLEAELEKLRARPPSGATAPPRPESERVEELLRAANACKVIVFTRGAAAASGDVCFKLRAAAGLPDHATAGAFKAGSVWIVSLINRHFTIEVLKKWYAFSQLTRWGLDQALTKMQLAERTTRKPHFMQLKAAGAFPRWHGSDIFVRMTTGVRPAAQWNVELRLPPRQRGPPPAAAAAPTNPPRQPPTAAAAAASAGVAASAAAPAAAGAAAPATHPRQPPSAAAAAAAAAPPATRRRQPLPPLTAEAAAAACDAATAYIAAAAAAAAAAATPTTAAAGAAPATAQEQQQQGPYPGPPPSGGAPTSTPRSSAQKSKQA